MSVVQVPAQARVCQSCERSLAVYSQTFDDLATFQICGACISIAESVRIELIQR